MKNRTKRIIALFLSVIMVLSGSGFTTIPVMAEGEVISTGTDAESEESKKNGATNAAEAGSGEENTSEAGNSEESTSEADNTEGGNGLTADVDGIHVSVDDINGVLPEGAYIKVERLEDEDALKMANDFAGTTEDNKELVRDAIGVDITFYSADGTKLEPSDDVQVSIDTKDYRSLEIEDTYTNPSYEVLHIPEEGDPVMVEDVEATKEGAVFESDEFSPYILTASPVNLLKANSANILPGFSDYSPYLKLHKLSIDGKELKGGETIEPSKQFQLELSFTMNLNDMSKCITDSTDGLHYSYPLPDHISIGNKGSEDAQVPLYNSRNVQIGTYYIVSDPENGDVMYVTFPGFYDEVTTNFELSASWSQTEDQDSIEVPWGDRVDKFFINRTSLIITKDQTHAQRGEDGITRNKFTITIKAKDDLNDVTDVSFKDDMTTQHFILDPESIDDGSGNKYAYKITCYDADGVMVGTPSYYPASIATIEPAGDKGEKTSIAIDGLTVPKGGKAVVEYTVYIPREVKRQMDSTLESDTLDNTAAASHPVTNRKTGQVEHPWITSEVTDSLIPKKEWLLKDANNNDLVKVTDTDNTEYIAMGYSVEINPLRQYTMGGAIVTDKISNSSYDDQYILETNVTYDFKNLANEKPYVIKTVKADTVTMKELTWITLPQSVYDDYKAKIDVKHPLDALDRLENNPELAGVRAALQSAVANAGYTFSGDYTDYIFTDSENHSFIWITPEDEDNPDKPGDKIVGTYKLCYHTVSGLKVNSFANSASLRYREMDPITYNAVGEPGDYFLRDRKIDATKHNEGVYLGEDGNFYVDWTLSVGVPEDSRGWEDIMIIDEFPRYEIGTGDDRIVYSDWLKGLSAPNYEGLNGGAFQFSSSSTRDDVQAVVNRARVGLDNGYWNAYSETMTSNFVNGAFQEVPDDVWIDKLSKWNSEAFNATIVSRGTYYSGADLQAGQFIVQEDGTDWVGKVKKGDTGTINNYTIYLGDLPSTVDQDGYRIEIKYTTMINPLMVMRLPDILDSEGLDVVTLTNKANVYHSYVKRDAEGNILGRALMQGGTSEGFIPDTLQASYWLGSGDATDCIQKDKIQDYDKTTGAVKYKTVLNKGLQLLAHPNVYSVQDAMNVPGVLYKNINLKFPAGLNGGASIITNGKVENAYKDYVTINVTGKSDSSNSLTITFDNKDSMFQDASGKVAQLELSYDADFKTNDVATDITLNNSVVLSEEVPNASGDGTSTKLIDQATVEYTVDKALDKRLDANHLPSEANNFTAGYSIVVDPSSANAKELANVAVGETFTVRDTMGSNMDLILGSVIVNQIEGGATTIITDKCKLSYDALNRVLDVKIPKASDTATYKIDYSVNVSHLSKDGAAEVKNSVEILGTTVKKEEVKDRISIYNSSESSDATTNMIRIQKYDMDDLSQTVDATFDIYKYSNGWKNLTSGSDRIYDSDFPISTVNGKVIITNKIPDNKPHSLIEKDTWYKLVELSTTEGYTVNAEPLYYYVSTDGQIRVNPPSGVTKYSIATLISGKSESEIEEDTLPTLLFGNKKVGFSILKNDKATKETIKDVEFGIYSDAECTNELATDITDENGLAEFTGITTIDNQGNGTIYLKEKQGAVNYLENNSIYRITFENGFVKEAVNKDDASDTLEIDSTGAISKVTFPNIAEDNSLIIEKKLTAKTTLYDDEIFGFIIALKDQTGADLTGIYDAYKYEKDGTVNVVPIPIKNGDRFELKTGEKLKIEKLPTGATYTVTEFTPADYSASVSVTDNIGTDTKTINAGAISGTIEQGSTDDVVFNNMRKTSLLVVKTASTPEGLSLNIPDGHTVTIRTDNNQTGHIWAIAKYNKSSGLYESVYMDDPGMKFHTELDGGVPINGGFRITGINTDRDLAVVESNAEIAGYAYKLVGGDYWNVNAKWSGTSEDSRTVALNNVYYNSFAEVNMSASKRLLGRNMADGEFTFSLYESSGDSYSRQIKTGVTNDAQGNVDFGRITYTFADLGSEREKTFYYRIAEERGSNAAIGYDTGNSVYVKVHIHKETDAQSGDETLVADAPVYSTTDMKDGSAGDGTNKEFVNTYSASGAITLKGNKTMKGKDATDGQFTYSIKEYTDSTFATEKTGVASPIATASTGVIAKDGNADFEFSAINYSITSDKAADTYTSDTGYHYYIIKEDVPDDATDITLPDGTAAKTKNGIIYDIKEHEIAIQVTDDGEGHLDSVVKKVEDDGSIGSVITPGSFTTEFAFTNVYEAKGSLDIKANKVLKGRDMVADEFGFTVAEYTDNTYGTPKKDSSDKAIEYTAKSVAAQDQADSEVDFEDIQYTLADVGTHYYKMTEDQPTGAGVTRVNGRNKKNGILYDGTEYKFSVVVTDKGNGTLEITVYDDENNVISDTRSKFAYINEYSATGDITFTGVKEVEGHDIIKNEYVFRIVELAGGQQVPLNSYGQVTQSASVDPVTKTATANITFTPINYSLSDLGDHTYLVFEYAVNGYDVDYNGVTYDSHAYQVTVHVADNGDGTLDAKITQVNRLDIETQTPEPKSKDDPFLFTNVYNASTSMTIRGSKSINAGAKTLAESKTFKFQLIEETAAGETVLATGTNDDQGDVTFYDVNDPTQEFKLSFMVDGANQVPDANDMGLHKYKVVEVDAQDPGYIYDTDEYSFRLNVSDNFDGTIHIEDMDRALERTDGTTDGKDDLRTYTLKPADSKSTDFVNSYEAYGDITFDGTKTLAGKFTKNSRTLDDDEFTFTAVEYTDDTYETPIEGAVYTGISKKDGAIVYDTIDYERSKTRDDVGTHYYRITEDIPADAEKQEDGTYKYKGITYSDKAYDVEVVVTDNDDGTLSTTTSGIDQKLDFENVYEAYGQTTITLTKETLNKLGKVYEGVQTMKDKYTFEFELSEVILNDEGKEEEKVLETISTGLNETASFKEISYDLDGLGKHVYKVREKKGKLEGFTYDEAVYEVEVDVTDNRDGTLTADQIIKDAEKIKFTNSYDATGEVTLSGTKTVADIEKIFSKMGLSDGMFTFTVTETVNGEAKTVSTGKNDTKGNISFTPIKYEMSDIGTHTYTVTEDDKNPVAGIVYDTVPVIVTVEVADVGNGTLSTVVNYKKQDVKAEKAGFDNKASEVKIKKTDKDGKLLPGAEFKIVTKDGNVVTTFTSGDSIYELYGLALDTEFTLSETKAPEGYKLAADTTFKISKDGQLYVGNEKSDMITVVDERVETSSSSRRTGDSASLMLMLILMLISTFGILYIGKKKLVRD